MAPRNIALSHHPTQNAPKGLTIPLVGPLFSFETSRIDTHVHPEFSRL